MIDQSLPSQASLSVSNSKQKALGKKGKLLNINSKNSAYDGSQISSGKTDPKFQKFHFNMAREEEELKLSKPVDIPKPEKKEEQKKEDGVIENTDDEPISKSPYIKKPIIPSLKIPAK